MRSRVALVITALLVLALGVGGALWWTQRERARDAGARAAVTAYVTGWNGRDMTQVPFADDAAAADFTAATEGLGDASVEVAAAAVTRDGGVATTDLSVRWTLPGDVAWSYAVPARVVESGGSWAVAAPDPGRSLWHPDLAAGETVELDRTSGTRGDLLDRDGTALMPLATVYAVQLDPVNATPASAAALEGVVGAGAGSLVDALTKATASGSKAPIPVITYREADFAPRKDRLEALPGVIAPTAEQPLARTRTFGQPLLGTFGEVTAEMVEKSEGRYVAGDRAGRSGLQAQYDTRLAGTPGLTVSTSGDRILFEQAPVDGADVATTLSPRVQEAAEKALADAGLTAPAALVAVDVPSGQVLAAANSPTTGFDRAITGRYPPGSTFKVATTYAYLTRGITTPSAKVACPATATIDGREFRNYAGESIRGTPTFFQNFIVSCNTAFVGLSPRLGDDDLTTAAEALGIGAGWADSVGVAGAFDGSVPATSGGTDAAAGSIGQGRTEVSPLAMAVMSGSIGRGTFVPPMLVEAADGSTPRPSALDGDVIAQIRSMMASVVSSGTGTGMRGTPGGPVRGKTGTAEHGSDPDAAPQVWFTGYQGDVAFAVLVEEGKSGGTVAAPIAKDFLTLLTPS
ncbi:MAG TPA: penicillin-binding transpeptidase domain-containing protein [Ornithinibacter sp.]|nr:penicillin-binding transpeptidase domain-containing protein [Ornithinibacter sp.]